MTRPLRAMDKAATLLDQIEAINALAVTAEVATLNLKPLARMDAEAAIRRMFAKLSEISVASGGEAVARPGPFEDLASAIVQLEQTIVVVTETVEGGEDDGVPDWVPDDFAEGIYIDLVGGSPQGRAWVAGVGEVAVDTLLGTDPATEAGWGATAYDSQYLTANGYVPAKIGGWTLRIGFIGAARTAILAGSTCAWQIKQVGVDTVDPAIFVLSEEVNSGIYFDLAMPSEDAHTNSYSGDLDETISNIMNVGADSLNRVAFTLTPTRAEMAVNGSAHVAAVIDTDEFPTSGDDPISMALVDLGRDPTHALQFIGIKTTPLPDTTGLQALSALE